MILVTGATSAVGTAVLKELLARKILVRAFVRKPFAAEKLEAQIRHRDAGHAGRVRQELFEPAATPSTE